MKILSCELKFDSMLHDFDTSIWFTFSEFADSWKMMRSFSIKFCRLQKKNQRRKMEKLPVSFFFSFYSGIWNLTTMHFWQYVEFKTDIQKSLCLSLKKISVTTFINSFIVAYDSTAQDLAATRIHQKWPILDKNENSMTQFWAVSGWRLCAL